MNPVVRILNLGLVAGVLIGCSQSGTGAGLQNSSAEGATTPLDTGLIADVLGVAGVEQDGQYKVSFPQNDLAVSVDGFSIVPPMGLTSWAAFAPAPAGAVVMGDLVVEEHEIGAVQRALIDSGLTVTALHNHFVRDSPKVMFMHIHEVGSVERLARGVRAAVDAVQQQRSAEGLAAADAVSVTSTFDPQPIETILGHTGKAAGGVYKITVGRPDVTLIDHGVEVSSFMGFNTWMAFQGSAERAAVAGDFVMLAPEVEPVIEALVGHGIEVVAVHNHMIVEEPRVFFLHFWGVAPVEELARGLKAALDQVGSGPGN